MERFRSTSFDVRTQEFRDLVRRSREVVLLAAITGALTGLLVRFFEYVVTEVMLERVLTAPLWFGAIAPGVGLVLAAILLHTVGGGASAATSDEYLQAFHDPEYPVRRGPSSAASWPRWSRSASAARWVSRVRRCTAAPRSAP